MLGFYTRDKIEWGATWGCVTLGLGFSKNVSLQKFKNIANTKPFFDYLRHFMHNYAFSCYKIFKFHKNGDISRHHQNFSNFSAHAAPKMCHFSPFFSFSALSATQNVSLKAKTGPPFWPVAPPNSIPVLHVPYLFFKLKLHLDPVSRKQLQFANI